MDNVLVSVVVITYNSDATVIETLNSVKKQSHHPIQLIVADDASTDNTASLVYDWLAANKEHFQDTCLTVAEKNVGTSANCNRGLKYVRGEWVKFIAGDDIMFPNFIADNMDYIKSDQSIEAVQSLCRLYKGNFDSDPIATEPSDSKYGFFSLPNGKAQYDFILHQGNYIYAPSMFLKKNTIDRFGGFDERFRLMEDYPLWLKMTRSDVRIHLLPVETVGYRIHEKSVIKNNRPFMSDSFAQESIFFLDNFFSGTDRDNRVKKEIFKFRTVLFFNKIGLNRRGFIPKVLYSLLFKF